MAYTKTDWANNSNPPINATNLNKIEDELLTLDTAVEGISTRKVAVVEEILNTSISTTTTDALIKDKDNFDYLELYYNALDNEGNTITSSVKIKVTQGAQTTVLPIGWWYQVAQEGIQFLGIYINGKDITYGHINRLLISPTGVSTTTTNTTITIISVLGIKYEGIIPNNVSL